MLIYLVRLLTEAGGDLVRQRVHADEHLGLAYVSASLRGCGHEVRILDSGVMGGVAKVVTTLSRIPMAGMVGFTVDCSNAEVVSRVSRDVRAMWRLESPVVCWGGHHASLCARAILEDWETTACAVVVLGDGELTAPEVASAVCLANRLGEPPTTYMTGVMGIGFRPRAGCPAPIFTGPATEKVSDSEVWKGLQPDRAVLDEMGDGQQCARILASRGCPHNCSFCTTPAVRKLCGQPSWIGRDAGDVVDEIEVMVKQRGIRRFYFNDDLFLPKGMDGWDHATEIAHEILERELDIEYKVELRADSLNWGGQLDMDLLKQLNRSGMKTVFLGAESGSDRMLGYLGKGVKSRDVRTAVLGLRRAGIRVNLGRILFGPDTTWEELEESLGFLGENDGIATGVPASRHAPACVPGDQAV